MYLTPPPTSPSGCGPFEDEDPVFVSSLFVVTVKHLNLAAIGGKQNSTKYEIAKYSFNN